MEQSHLDTKAMDFLLSLDPIAVAVTVGVVVATLVFSLVFFLVNRSPTPVTAEQRALERRRRLLLLEAGARVQPVQPAEQVQGNAQPMRERRRRQRPPAPPVLEARARVQPVQLAEQVQANAQPMKERRRRQRPSAPPRLEAEQRALERRRRVRRLEDGARVQPVQPAEQVQGNAQPMIERYQRPSAPPGLEVRALLQPVQPAEQVEGNVQPMIARRQRPSAPPAQILCEALSMVCDTEVRVTLGEGTWGGQGWVKKRFRSNRLHSSSSPPRKLEEIVLPLVNHQKQTAGDEWSQLEGALHAIVSPSSHTDNPLGILTDKYGPKGVALMASWHRQSTSSYIIEDTLKIFYSNSAVKEDSDPCLLANKEGLGRCLPIVAKYAAGTLAKWLDSDISQELDLYEDEEEDLFSEYARSANAARDQAIPPDSAMAEFLDICGQSNAALLLPKRLLSDMISQSANRLRLAQGFLEKSISRLPIPNGTSKISFQSLAKALSAISHLLGNSVDTAAALSARLKAEVSSTPSGKSFEDSSVLWPLLSLVGYTLPCVGLNQSSRFCEALKRVETFPMGAFGESRKSEDRDIKRVTDEARRIMQVARSEASEILKKHCSRGKNCKDEVYRWLGVAAQSNEMQANLLDEQLLDSKDDVHETLSSRSFLIGATMSLLEMSCSDLVRKYDRDGVELFDPRYPFLVESEERRLVNQDGITEYAAATGEVPENFSGATECFFLSSALLRVSVFPAIRAQRAYYSDPRKRKDIRDLEALASSGGTAAQVPEYLKRLGAAILGQEACLQDQELMKKVVEFCILQLRYLADLSEVSSNGGANLLALIPEHMAKQPAQFIAQMAKRFQNYLTPRQAEQAAEYSTRLLGSRAKLSIQVQTELMRISGAFIEASVRREAWKEGRKFRRNNRRGASRQEDEVIIDERWLDIYSSLDKNDHGVVVFASPFLTKHLGPTLVETFTAMDAVEGLDVDKDHNFHKHMVQGEICELLLRLWYHPGGDFKTSISSLSGTILSRFIRSVTAAIGSTADFCFQSILDIKDLLEQTQGRPMNPREEQVAMYSYRGVPGQLNSFRRLFLLLSSLSEDDRIASEIMGDCDPVASELGVMVISLLDKFTAANGATHPELDFCKVLSRAGTRQVAGSDNNYIKNLIDARTFAMNEFGFDVSMIAHLVMSLAARWSLAAKKSRGDLTETPPAFVNAILSHDDFNIRHFRNVFERLIATHTNASAGAQDDDFIIKVDGHIPPWIWKDRYKAPQGIGLEENRFRSFIVKQDQLTHTEIDEKVGCLDEIEAFLDALEKGIAYREAKMPSRGQNRIPSSPDEILKLERRLLQGSESLDDEDYSVNLKDWVVSSDTFSSENNPGVMNHFYGFRAKASSNPGLGRILIKDARKCWKILPRPHPNASIFACYSEERMDICRAMIVGATETPYSMGLFQFDICYPALYPSQAPMVHFMTTGGGQVRFGPNLYNDGKVCLSLLGTYNAGEESQRWNPNVSSLAQVLVGIQSQMLNVAEPYYAEGGGHEGQRGTRAGKKGSARYNNTLRLSTLRHAVIEPLRNPAEGFEEVTRRHFAMCRKRLLVQAKRWTLESRGTDLHGRFLRAYSELVVLLSNEGFGLPEDCESKGSSSDGANSAFGALPPVASDMLALSKLDPKVHREFNTELQGTGSDASNATKLNEAMAARVMALSLGFMQDIVSDSPNDTDFDDIYS